MKFNGGQAWNEAVEMANSNREILWPVAGVFLLLPTLATTFFLSDFQTAAMTNPAAAAELLKGMLGPFFAVVLTAFVVQMVGYMALMKLLHDRERPTIGQAIQHGISCLPSILGASILFYIALFIVMLVLGMVVGGMAAATGSGLIAGLLVGVMLVGMAYLMIRLSLTMPVIVVEGQRNPVNALLRSWQLTGGNTGSLALFYIVLGLAYGVISLLVGGALGAVLGATIGMGTAGMLVLGLLSGLIGALVAVVFAAVLVAIHRQLSGDSEASVSATFD